MFQNSLWTPSHFLLNAFLSLSLSQPGGQKFPNTCLFSFEKSPSQPNVREVRCVDPPPPPSSWPQRSLSFGCAQNRVISFFALCVFVWGCVIFTPELPLSAARIDTRQHKGVAPPSNMLNVKSAFLCSVLSLPFAPTMYTMVHVATAAYQLRPRRTHM